MPASRRRHSYEDEPNELRDFLTALATGEYDNDLVEIQFTLDERKETFKQKLHILVKEVFGENAFIQINEKPNPFVERKAPPIVEEQVQEEEPDQPMPDTLSSTEQNINEGILRSSHAAQSSEEYRPVTSPTEEFPTLEMDKIPLRDLREPPPPLPPPPPFPTKIVVKSVIPTIFVLVALATRSILVIVIAMVAFIVYFGSQS